MRRATWFSRLAESRIPNRLGIAISAAIIAIAVVVLYHELSDIDIRVTLTALRQTPPQFIALSGLFVALAVPVGLRQSGPDDSMKPEKRLFAFSVLYLFALFTALVADRMVLA